jgi:hypothetical protein
MNRRAAATTLLAALLSTAIAPGAQAAPRTLRLAAEQRGVRTVLELQIDGARVSGHAVEQATRYPLAGQLEGEKLDLLLRDPSSGLMVAWLSGTLQGERYDAKLQPLLNGAAATRAVFTRAGESASAAAPAPEAGAGSRATPGALDPRFVGRWVRQSMVSSTGGAGGSASFSTERTLELAADGQVRQWVRSAGGGAGWSAGSGSQLEFSGRWQLRQGELWVQRQGESQFHYAAHARLAGAYLVTENQAGRQIWER